MTRKYFGTDGIRGVATEALTADLALAVGRAAVAVLPSENPVILVGRDTRVRPMLETALMAGINSAGGRVIQAGSRSHTGSGKPRCRQGADVYAVISASHNPYQDNGIKFFGCFGASSSRMTRNMKWSASCWARRMWTLPASLPARPAPWKSAVETYVDSLVTRDSISSFPVPHHI